MKNDFKIKQKYHNRQNFSNVVAPSSAYSSVDVDAIFAELVGDNLPSSKKSDESKNVEKVTGFVFIFVFSEENETYSFHSREKKEENVSASTSSEPPEVVTTSKMTTVTEVFDFAGDEVR